MIVRPGRDSESPSPRPEEGGVPPKQHPPQGRSARPALARLMLLVYVAGLCLMLTGERRLFQSHDVSLWDLQETHYLLGRIAWVVAKGPLVAALFFPVGALCLLSVRRSSRPGRDGLIALALGLVLAIVVRGFDGAEPWRWPGVSRLIAPTLGLLPGIWLAAAFRNGRRSFRRTMGAFALLGLLLIVALGILFVLMLDDQPLQIPQRKVSAAEKRRLVDLVRSRERFQRDGASVERISLSEEDLNQLIAWGLTLGSENRRAAVKLDDGAATLKASAPIRLGFSQPRYLNVKCSGAFEVLDGRLKLDVNSIRIGSVSAPGPAVRFASWLIGGALKEDYHARQIIQAVCLAKATDTHLTVELERSALDRELFSGLSQRIGANEETLEAARHYYRHLVTRSAEFPKGDQRFLAYMQTAFQLAQERSQRGDPVVENQAAILALGVILGHYRLEAFTGPITDKELAPLGRRETGRATIRGRSDWTRHYILSAALALLSKEHVSNAVGLFKEEYDAGPKGSGFSFGDLLADRAGTSFAMEATRSKASARRVQEMLARPVSIDVLFPPAADLPEGLTEQEFKANYGGVEGRRYREVANEIERRVKSCEILSRGKS